MKKLALISSILLSASLVSNSTLADMSPHKKAGLFGGSAIAGAIVGGPVGYILGAAAGAYIAEKTDEVDDMKNDMVSRNSHIQFLEDELAFEQANLSAAKHSVASLQEQLRDEASAPVFFETGSDQLTLQAKQNLTATIEYLQSNQDAQVWLEGYTDPRGTDGYNLTLSQARAKNVKEYLVENGIAEQIIQTQGFGMKSSSHDATMFDLERRVEINLDSNGSASVAMK